MAGVYGSMIIPQKARGGALPEYQGGGAPYTPGAGISARLSGEGGRVAAAAVKAAADADASRGAAAANLARAANNAVQIGLKAYGDYESAVAQNAFNQYQQEEMRLRAELGTLQGRNALGDEGVEARLSRWRADARERLGADLGEIGQRMFHRAADNLDAQSDAWATGKVNKENIAFQNSVSEGSILNARNMALENPADEGALARADGIIKAEYERMASRSGWDDAYRDAKYAEARGKLAFDRAAALIDAGDLDAARRAIGGSAAFRNGGHFTGKLPTEYAELADAEARAQGLPPALAMAVMAQESGGRKDAVSRSGARGLMQLMPGTAKALGVNPDDPRENVRGGVTYLKQMLDHYNGNMEHALMAYNWGPGNMDAWLKTGKGMQGQPMPKETREYASGVLGRIGGDTEGATQAGAGGAPSLLTQAQRTQLQGKIDHARREQAQEAGLTTQAFGNHLEYGLEKGDFTAAEKDVTALRGLGFTGEAAELSGRLELARTAHSALNDASDLPLVEQATAVHVQLDSLVTPDNAKAATAMRDNVDRALAQKKAAFIKDPAASVAALPAMQGEMQPQERVQRSMELQARMGMGLAFEPHVLPAEQARQLKAAYDKLDSPASRVAWLGQFANTYGPYARQALHEMQVPEQVVTLLPVLGAMNEKSMGLALSAIEVKDGDIPGLDKDAKQAAVDAAASNRLLKDVLALSRAFPANEDMRRFGQGMETMLTNYVKLGGNLEDFDKAFESAASGECFLMLPRNAGYDVDDVVDATRGVREDLREKLLAGVHADTQQGRIDRANLSGLIDRGVFVSDETGTKVMLIDPQHGRPVLYSDGMPMNFDIAAIVKSRAERKARLRHVAESLDDDMAGLEVES